MTWHSFALDRLARQPWRNGGGVTREIVCQPAGATMDDFDWRVSVADVASDGAFSVFPGVDRTIMLLEGSGLHLRSECGQIEHRLDAPWVPLGFAGELRIAARMIGGPSEDFNVMTRRQRCRATLRVVDAAERWQKMGAGLLLALRGSWTVRADAANEAVLSPGDGLWWSDGSPLVEVEPGAPDARLARVEVSYHDGVGR